MLVTYKEKEVLVKAIVNSLYVLCGSCRGKKGPTDIEEFVEQVVKEIYGQGYKIMLIERGC